MADDFQRLVGLVEDLQARLREETEKRVALERRCNVLEKLVYLDPETGLGTRDYLMARVREEIDRATRYPSATTLLTLCSPEEHSERLARLGSHLVRELRESDHVFSLTSCGLAVLLVETPHEGAEKVLDRMASDLKHFIKGYGYSVTSFPLDTNVPEEFFELSLERHEKMSANVLAGVKTDTSSAAIN